MELEEILKNLELSGGIVITGISRRVTNFLAALNEATETLRGLMRTDVLDANTRMFHHIVRRAINVREIALIFGKVRNSEAIKEFQQNIDMPFGSNISREASELAVWALEKQIPKKPVHDGCFDSEGIWHEWNGVNGRPYDLCPKCNTNLCCEMPYDNKPKYCKHCGQKLDWSDEE